MTLLFLVIAELLATACTQNNMSSHRALPNFRSIREQLSTLQSLLAIPNIAPANYMSNVEALSFEIVRFFILL